MLQRLSQFENVWWSIGKGYMRGIAYDTARVSMLGNGNRFPRALLWILTNQKKNGSWGEEVLHLQDRAVSTLSCVLALKMANKPAYKSLIDRGLEYLNSISSYLRYESCSMVGFELIYPRLIDDAEEIGIDVSQADIKWLRRAVELKLRSLNIAYLAYIPNTTFPFSLEFLGPKLDRTRAQRLIGENGSVLSSPSATAFLLTHLKVRSSMNYLKSVQNLNRDGSIVDVYPFDVFERAWALFNHMLTGRDLTDIMYGNLRQLQDSWTRFGVGIAAKSPLRDSDDTAVAFKVLSTYGFTPDPVVFEQYERDDKFLCFHLERDASVSANIHILDAIKSCTNYPRRDAVVDKIIKFLVKQAIEGCYWKDKWHLSPYYATSHAVLAIADLDQSIVGKAVDWIARTQNPDGSWGVLPNAEETAYALQALLFYQKFEKSHQDNIAAGLRYIANLNPATYSYPALWVGKGLYAPENVIKSVVLSALHLGHRFQQGGAG